MKETKLDREIRQLILRKSHLKTQLNSSYGSTISVLPSKASVDIFLIDIKLEKLKKLRDRFEKIEYLKQKINGLNKI